MIGSIIDKCKDFHPDKKYVTRFEGEIKWGRHGRHFDCHRLTWADYDDSVVGPECGSGNYILTLGNGERWEGKLIRGFYCSGPWTCTNKDGTIEEVIQFSKKED